MAGSLMMILQNRFRRESGQAMIFALVVMAIASAIGLAAIAAVGRSLATEGGIRRQSAVDTLAVSASEEVFGRVARSVNGLAVVTSHPGYDVGSDVDSEVWVRFSEDGHIVNCTNASKACFTVRLDANPRDLSRATSAVIQVTARQCRGDSASFSSCVFARRQTAIRKRHFSDYVLWINSASQARFNSGDRVAGPIHLNTGSLLYCGVPELGLDTSENPDRYFRVEAFGSPVVAQSDSCVNGTSPTMSTSLVGDADAFALPVVSAADYAVIAGGMPAAAAATIQLNGTGTGYTLNGVSTSLPLNGVIVVNGPLELSSTAPFSGNLTVVATGDITITSDLQLDSQITDMLGVVSTGGNIYIEFVDSLRTIEALLFAPSLANGTGIVRATGITPCSESCPALVIYGAIVARELGAMAEVDTSGVITQGFSKSFSYDERFARSQPPFAISQTRGLWMRLGMSTVSPLTPGVYGFAPKTTIAPPTTTTVPSTTTTTTTVPLNLDTSGDESATAPASTGTFTDTANGLTLVRTASSLSADTTTANWEYISVTYNPGSGEVTNTVLKSAGADVVGVLTRNSNKNVTVALTSSVAFTLTVKYNGKSVGTTYLFPGPSCADGGVCEVGNTGPGGGTVFYVSASNFTSTGSDCGTTCKYLEAAPNGWSVGITLQEGEIAGSATSDPRLKWCSNNSTLRNATTKTAIGDGRSNTTNGLTCTSGAIFHTELYANNGKTDWHLTSKDELNQMCKWVRGQAQGADGTMCNNTGSMNSGIGASGFSDGTYLSSSETNASTVHNFLFSEGVLSFYGKFWQDYVRPVRAFG
jgi:hypothetical protein